MTFGTFDSGGGWQNFEILPREIVGGLSGKGEAMKKYSLWGIPVVLVLLVASLAPAAAQDGDLTDVEELGKSIFFDINLSINSNQSCASCHDPDVGWTGPDSDINAAGAVYEGSILGQFGNRKPPSSAYATQSPIFHPDKKGTFIGGNFWDGRATGEVLGNPAADQAQGPFINPLEQALASPTAVVSLVCAASYAELFTEVWGPAACDEANVLEAYDQIALSVAAFEGSPEVDAFTSKYDAKSAGMVKLTKKEQKGFALFQGKAGCKACHPSNGEQPLFTDFTFDNLGIPRNLENPFYEADLNPLGSDWVDFGLGGFLASRPEYEDYGEANDGKHKVPTLRNVDLRPGEGFVKAYGHNGYFKSLEGIVNFYNTRDVKPECPDLYTETQALAADCWPEPEVAENVNRDELGDLGLTSEEEAAIVAFLKTLSDGYTP